MRRQSVSAMSARHPTLSSRLHGVFLSIQPFRHPERICAHACHIRLDGRTLVLDREIAGIKMRVGVPITLFEGVAIHVKHEASAAPRVSVVLLHRNRSMDVELHGADHDRDATAEWQAWARHLGLPMLAIGPDGRISTPFPMLGALTIEKARSRRKPSHLVCRRPRFLARRKTGQPVQNPAVYREREIIARN